jgi:hypothetical protein
MPSWKNQMRTPILTPTFLATFCGLLVGSLWGMNDRNESPEYSNLTTPATTSPSSLIPSRMSPAASKITTRTEYGEINLTNRKSSDQSESGSIASTQPKKSKCSTCTLLQKHNLSKEELIQTLRAELKKISSQFSESDNTLKELSKQLSESNRNQISLKANQKNLWDSSLKIGCAACVGFVVGGALALYHPDWFRVLLESRKSK